ncbi:ferritin-like fold-containing protein [Allobranchiibius sp. CTAmp26]|uniref:ferritin-like fold-containing protein n=1 Tax=Allobranchiibius sp. CTAmp26 TaxID=2815214 RepID=UPI001AA1341C|nr:ferritin-like fold-containing protein [Allobranchiibius sp. CTAmp26]MBO1755753.1 hydroxylase [Allobranchiibius sp. CTAmp26]
MTDTPTQASDARPTDEDLQDPAFRSGVAALLGVLAYGELKSFFATVEDAGMAPGVGRKEAMAAFAVREFEHYQALSERLRQLDVDPQRAMEPVVDAVDEWHRRTKPKNWTEGLMKAYAGQSIATDFYRECAQWVDPTSRTLMLEVLGDNEQADYVEAQLRDAIAADGRVASTLALWGRRLVGEAITQAQLTIAENEQLERFLVADGSGSGMSLEELSELFTRLTDAHKARMETLGLTA